MLIFEHDSWQRQSTQEIGARMLTLLPQPQDGFFPGTLRDGERESASLLEGLLQLGQTCFLLWDSCRGVAYQSTLTPDHPLLSSLCSG